MSKKTWLPLTKNDVIDVVAPASHSPQNRLEDGLEWIKDMGFVPRVPEDIILNDIFFAAPLPIQLKHLKDAIYSDSKAIWCLRGGYGSMRLVPHLLKLHPPKKPKLFMGFSDITALHLFFTQNWKWPTIHGRTVAQMNPDFAMTPDRRFLKDVITGKKIEKTFKNLVPLNEVARRDEVIHGPITGGNLRILQSSLGTSWELRAKGKILFIEDVSERGYSIDRMLEQMIQARIIDKGLKAVVFGDFTGGLEKDGTDLTHEALHRFATRVPYPVLRGLPAGHGEINYPIPFNTVTTLKTGRRPELRCSYGTGT